MSLKDGLATIGAIYIALAAAGMVGVLLFRAGLAPVASLAAYTVLLGVYAFLTGPGRRTAAPVYLFIGFVYPVIGIGVLIYSIGAPAAVLEAAGVLFAGIGIGFQQGGGPDTPLEAYLPLIYANILVPILLVLLARAVWTLARRD